VADKGRTVQAGETVMTESNQSINRRNNRDEWSLVVIAIVLPLLSLLSVTL